MEKHSVMITMKAKMNAVCEYRKILKSWKEATGEENKNLETYLHNFKNFLHIILEKLIIKNVPIMILERFLNKEMLQYVLVMHLLYWKNKTQRYVTK
jgi:hypothetical protein